MRSRPYAWKPPLKIWHFLLGFLLFYSTAIVQSATFDEVIAIYPDIYQQVLEENKDLINGDSNMLVGLESIQTAVTVDLNQTITCLNTLDAKAGQKCLNDALKLNKDTFPQSFLYDDSLILRKYNSLFTPGQAGPTVAKMLFDQSFFYWNQFGYDDTFGTVMFQCATGTEACKDDKTALAAAIDKVKDDFKNVLFSMTEQEKNKVVGRVYDLDWTNFTTAYNGNPKDFIRDQYNIWMANATKIDPIKKEEIATAQTLHHINAPSSIVVLDETERKSWFVGTSLAALYHLHYIYMLGPDGLFNKPSNKDETQFMAVILDEQFELTSASTWNNEHTASEGFIEWIAMSRASFASMKTMAQFQTEFHEQGKNFMLDRNNNYELMLKKLAAGHWYENVWYRQNGYFSYTSILIDLGYDMPLLKDVQEFVQTIFSVKTCLGLAQRAHSGSAQLTLYWIWYFSVMGAIAIATCFVVYVLIKSYMWIKCCCQCLGFCAEDDVDEGKLKKMKQSKVAPAGKKPKTKKAADIEEDKPVEKQPTPIPAPVPTPIPSEVKVDKKPSETRSEICKRLETVMDELKVKHEAERADLEQKLDELEKMKVSAEQARDEALEQAREQVQEERPVTREWNMQTSEIKKTPPPSTTQIEMQTSEIPRPVTTDIEAQTSVVVEKVPTMHSALMDARPDTADNDMQTSNAKIETFAIDMQTSEVEPPRPQTADVEMQTSKLSLLKSMVSRMSGKSVSKVSVHMLPQKCQRSPRQYRARRTLNSRPV